MSPWQTLLHVLLLLIIFQMASGGGEEKRANFIPCVNGNIFICVILSSSHPLSLPLKLDNKLTANYSVEIKTLIIINNAKYAIHAFHGHCLCGLEQWRAAAVVVVLLYLSRTFWFRNPNTFHRIVAIRGLCFAECMSFPNSSHHSIVVVGHHPPPPEPGHATSLLFTDRVGGPGVTGVGYWDVIIVIEWDFHKGNFKHIAEKNGCQTFSLVLQWWIESHEGCGCGWGRMVMCHCFVGVLRCSSLCRVN